MKVPNKKILIIANGIIGDDPGLSGGDVRFFEIAKYWQEWDYKLHILSSESIIPLLERFKLRAKVHIIPGTKNSERSSFLIRTLKTLFYFPPSLKGFKGLVYSVNDSLFDVIPAVKMKLRDPKNIDWLAIVHWLPNFPPWKRKKATLINSILFFINERISIYLANIFAEKILAVSESTKQQLIKARINKNKIKTVLCGVNYSKIREISKKVLDKKYDAVFMKRAQAVKGVFDLIEIWKNVVREKRDARLLMIGGEGHDGEVIKDLIKKENLSLNIEFAGYLYDFHKKMTKITQSRLFILPSYEENWAISIGEAMAAGLPILAYDLKELRMVWKDKIIYIPLGDISLFSKKIITLLNNEQIRKEMIKEGLRFIKKLSWEQIARDEISFFDKK